MPETPEQYRNRILGHLGGSDPLALQAVAAQRLARLLKGVHASKLRKRPAPDKWSIAEIVLHLADTELVGAFRIRMILGSPGTPVQGFDQDTWVVALHYDKRDVWEALEQFRTLREANLHLLKTLSPEQWKHHGVHSERGEETIETIVRIFAGHDINHFKQIEARLAVLRWSIGKGDQR
jgi:DinB superfamily